MTGPGREEIARQRCFNHADRVAAARCPECRRFFCRECVTEHEGRVFCKRCLEKLTQETPPGRLRMEAVRRFGQFSVGLFLLWFLFYLLGLGLLSIPDSFHEGTIWNDLWPLL